MRGRSSRRDSRCDPSTSERLGHRAIFDVDGTLVDSNDAPALAIMVGDTPYDVAAARGAGVRCIGFRCGGWDDDGLAGAIAVYEGPLDLWQRLDSSPFSRR